MPLYKPETAKETKPISNDETVSVKTENVRFEVLTAVILKIQVSWHSRKLVFSMEYVTNKQSSSLRMKKTYSAINSSISHILLLLLQPLQVICPSV